MSIKKAVFPVAGMGTRFLPATKSSPKEMLPLVDKPMIQYVVEEAIMSGIKETIMVTGRGKNAIEDHFDKSFELEHILAGAKKSEQLRLVQNISDMCDFWYLRQKQPLGLGHAILRTRDLVGNEPFAVLLGDDIIYSKVPVTKQLSEIYKIYQSPVIAVERVKRKETKNYGIIAYEKIADKLYRITDMVEKPDPDDAPSTLAVIGRYVLTPDIFRELERVKHGVGGEIQLTDGLKSLLRKRPIYAYEFDGTRYDGGSKIGFLKATVELALRREDLGAEFRRYLKNLDIDSIKDHLRR